MAPKQEQEFIRLWRQGATYRQIAAATPIPYIALLTAETPTPPKRPITHG